MNASVRTELADSMVTLGELVMAKCQEMSTLPAGYIPQQQQWVTGFHWM